MSAPQAAAAAEQNALDRSLASSLIWTTGAKWGAQIIGWLATIVVARLLTPDDYGLVGMATIYLGLIQLVSEFGLGSAVVTLQQLSTRQLAQLNSLAVVIGLAGTLVSIALNGPLSTFFHAPALRLVMIVMSIGFTITAFRVVPQALLQKTLRFKALAWVDLIQQITLSVGMVALAVLGFRYWTLVIGGLASGLISTIALMMLCPTPFALPRLRDLTSTMTFSWHVIVSRVAWYIQVHSDFVVAGRVLGQYALGVYNLAWSIATMPVEKITALVMRVTPAFLAAVQTNLPALRRYVLGLTEALALITFPAALGMALVASDFVAVVFGEKWLESTTPLQLLALHAAYQTVAAFPSQILLVRGETRFSMWSSLVLAVVLPFSFFVGARWGPTGIAVVWVIVYPLAFAPVYRRALRQIELPLSQYLAVLRPAIHGCGAMALAVFAAYQLSAAAPPGLRLAIQIAAGAIGYGAVVLGPHRHRSLTLLRMLRGGVATPQHPEASS
jgi:PST family polysaccharide transporter